MGNIIFGVVIYGVAISVEPKTLTDHQMNGHHRPIDRHAPNGQVVHRSNARQTAQLVVQPQQVHIDGHGVHDDGDRVAHYAHRREHDDD